MKERGDRGEESVRKSFAGDDRFFLSIAAAAGGGGSSGVVGVGVRRRFFRRSGPLASLRGHPLTNSRAPSSSRNGIGRVQRLPWKRRGQREAHQGKRAAAALACLLLSRASKQKAAAAPPFLFSFVSPRGAQGCFVGPLSRRTRTRFVIALTFLETYPSSCLSLT